ncbi:short chain dehydrogenase [Tilletiaria anomala UBC 951]|uniref:Short chain dehydrogenase n=1 Tax=Tilletiaria anomala (strain ATCC 24038 / CBS 436.72 / UBC 951) TaxID=1037660 RepID=A0A066VYN2_TILAU|nr:short chain dehydrogenase [Tilletiaria anomala UBC 951]KDN46611.1 short chain dehydrogenase [Tilletiaria anomala UBC 951]
MFGCGAKQWSAEEIPDLTGQVALVTGGNAGIGEASCLELARHGAKVYLAARSPERAKAALERIKTQDAEAASRIQHLNLDLADLESVKEAVSEFIAKEKRLHILLNNAGVMALPYSLTKQGLELQNGTNVIGHAFLTFLLLPTLVRTSRDPALKHSVRVVQVSSMGHKFGDPSPKQSWASIEAINKKFWPEAVGTWKRYAQSKTGNIILANELKKITAGENIANISLHPGNINTELMRGPVASYGIPNPILRALLSTLLLTPEQGALTSLYACTSPEVDEKKLNGAYLQSIARVGNKAAHAEDKDGVLGNELMAFVRSFGKEKINVDVDALIKEALAKHAPAS